MSERAFWISWFHTAGLGEFELHSPWWFSGMRCADEADTIVAAVRAPSETDAKIIVEYAYDKPPGALEWRFCEERPEGWEPFCGRFPRADWMKWTTKDTPNDR